MASEPVTMRALVFEGPAPDASRTRVDDVAVPQPGSGQVTIDVDCAGVNFKDVMARRGDAGYVRAWPFVPGLEAAGTVRTVGAGVRDFAVGDRVTAFTDSGGLAEVAVAPAALTVRVPDSLDLEVAAAAHGALATAVLLVEDFARVRAGDSVLVHSAAGGVGRAVAQVARLAGADRCVGTVGSTDRVAAARDAGYDAIVVRDATLAEAVRAATHGRGVDVVLDPQGTPLLDVDVAVTAPGGRVVLFGNAGGAALDPLPPAARLFATNVSVGGFSLGALAATAPERVVRAVKRVLDLLVAGRLDVELLVVDGLERAAEAQQALADGRGRGKQVVRVRRAGSV